MAKNIIAICLVVLIASSVIYEVQGTFLLKMYLRRRFPTRCAAFAPFAIRGMMMLASNLRGGCPATKGFRIFFGNFQNFLKFVSTASAASKNFNVEMNGRADMVAKALTGITGSASTAAPMRNCLLSMGKTMVQQRSQGSAEMSMQQRKELIVNMVSWTRTIISLVGTAAQKSGGKAIDQSAYGVDVDVNDTVKGGGSDTGSEATPATPEDTPATPTQDTPTKSGGASAKGTATKSATGTVSGDATGSGSTDVSGDYSSGASATKEASGTATATKEASGTATTAKGSTKKCTTGSGTCSQQATGGLNGQASFKGSISGTGSVTAGGY